jgi:bifunctional DNA-binding transcriptional regulator/antitoxin component of YhaV-PrlF toxin-antitoxin module
MMKATQETDAVFFSVKGQVVIPRWLRKEYHIEKGTRAVVYPDGDHIAVKPITAEHYRRLRGSLKGTGVLKALVEERKAERKR